MVWGGMWEHWQRATWDQVRMPTSLGGVGFSYGSPGGVLAWPETDPAMRARSNAEKRAVSFAMTQGGWTYLSTVAARLLVTHVLQRGAGTFGFAQRGQRLPRVREGVCTMPTDVGVGWLGAQVFAGVRLHTISSHHMLESLAPQQWPTISRQNDAALALRLRPPCSYRGPPARPP